MNGTRDLSHLTTFYSSHRNQQQRALVLLEVTTFRLLKFAHLDIVFTRLLPIFPPTHCSTSIILIQGCMVEQATAINISFHFVPGFIAHDPPRSTDDICLENIGREDFFFFLAA